MGNDYTSVTNDHETERLRPMTAVLTAPHTGKEAPHRMAANTRKPLDRTSLAERREDRYRRRESQILRDVNLDPRLVPLLLDRTLWGVREQAAFLDVHRARISVLRKNRILYRIRNASFPSVLPDMDAPMGEGDARPRPGIEAGRLREWALDDHRVIWNPDTGKLEVNSRWRAGRKRNVATGPTFTSRSKGTGDGRRALRGTTRRTNTKND
jgi:hypothetical protein